MIAAGARQICIVISAEKSDIVRYLRRARLCAEISTPCRRRPAGYAMLSSAPSPSSGRIARADGLPTPSGFPRTAFRVSAEWDSVNLVLFPVEVQAPSMPCSAKKTAAWSASSVKQRIRARHWIWGAVIRFGPGLPRSAYAMEGRHREDEIPGDIC